MSAMRERYIADVWGRNAEGSNRADSYLRALEYLGPILARQSETFAQCSDLFSISDSRIIRELYEYITGQQRLGENGIFHGAEKPSYWKSRFYSTALKDYMGFLSRFRYEEKLWTIYNSEGSAPGKLAEKLASVDIEDGVNLPDTDVSMPQGKDVLREITTRLNQRFFRSMIMRDYSSCCCLTIPKFVANEWECISEGLLGKADERLRASDGCGFLRRLVLVLTVNRKAFV
jgi:hypothetical protein